MYYKACFGTAGFVFAGMAVVSFLVILPASRVSDRLGRKWTIVPSAIAMATALLLMAAAGALTFDDFRSSSPVRFLDPRAQNVEPLCHPRLPWQPRLLLMAATAGHPNIND